MTALTRLMEAENRKEEEEEAKSATGVVIDIKPYFGLMEKLLKIGQFCFRKTLPYVNVYL